MFYYSVHKILTLVPLLSQIIPVHAVFLRVTSVLILSCIPLLGLQNNLFCIGILTKLYRQFYSLFISYISSNLVSLSYCVKFIWICICWHWLIQADIQGANFGGYAIWIQQSRRHMICIPRCLLHMYPLCPKLWTPQLKKCISCITRSLLHV